MKPQSVVLLVTPKIFPDFNKPDQAIVQFLERYKPVTSHSADVIVIFAVGNSDHMLEYRGAGHWSDNIEWARTTDHVPVSSQTLNYNQLDGIVRAFKSAALAAGLRFKIYDQIDSGGEFTLTNDFKYSLHPECSANKWGMFDIRAAMQDDHDHVYASAPGGINAGTLCGDFLVDQVSQYIHDLGFDGVLYDNQLGTRGRWHSGDGPGYSDEEASAIKAFLERSQRSLAGKDLMWFDSYNNTNVEHDTFSFPTGGYDYFDYLIASGFCVMAEDKPYSDNLESKLQIIGRPRILASLDYVDPWYKYNAMTDYPSCSQSREDIAIQYRNRIDGIMFFANDETGSLIPKRNIDLFASRFFAR